MIIAINRYLAEGPGGGGHSFIRQFIEHAKKSGIEIRHDLHSDSIDFILIAECRSWAQGVSFNLYDCIAYKNKHSNTKIFLRVNECDQRKGRFLGLNKLLSEFGSYTDGVIFVGSWLMRLHEWQRLRFQNIEFQVIKNAPADHFFNSRKPQINSNSTIRLVTHHWGGNYFKGHDVYRRIDEILEENTTFEFHFYGNLPTGIEYKNIKIHSSLSGSRMADELASFDGYITASRNEPGSNHNLEAMAVGLPVLYLDSGSLTEDCENFGRKIDLFNLEKSINDFINDLPALRASVLSYSRRFDSVFREYIYFFKNSENYRNKISKIHLLNLYFWSCIVRVTERLAR